MRVFLYLFTVIKIKKKAAVGCAIEVGKRLGLRIPFEGLAFNFRDWVKVTNLMFWLQFEGLVVTFRGLVSQVGSAFKCRVWDSS